MNQLLTKQQQNTILTELNQAADHAVWAKSKFLTVVGKQVVSIRDDFKKLVNPVSTKQPVSKSTETSPEMAMTTVYISLYCAKGVTTKNWLPVLASLPTQLVSRPIYLDETQATEMIKSKLNKDNEAYLTVQIPSNTIQQLVHDKIPLDKLGHPLATLKGRPLNKYFTGVLTHHTGKYQYSDGQLTKL